MTIAWITSVFGGIDEPKEIPEQTVPFTHFHFSERNNPRFLDRFNNRTKALFFKSQAHKLIEADYYIYTDGKIQPTSPNFIEEAIKQLNGNSLGMQVHPVRNCIYEEVDHIEDEIKKGNLYLKVRYGNRPIREEVEFYRSEGYPKNNGLHDAAVFIRTPETNGLFDKWWNHISDENTYDQICLEFLAWRNEVKIQTLHMEKHFKQVRHLKIA
jgi:hypothetical protein